MICQKRGDAIHFIERSMHNKEGFEGFCILFDESSGCIMKVKRKKAFFSISAVAEMFSIHQQTVRLYEKEGLICPKRSEGNTRLFSEEDINRLEEIIYLTHQLGINLAGVEMILKLKKQMSKMQKDMNRVFEQTAAELDHEGEVAKKVVRESIKQITAMKPKKQPSASTPVTPGLPAVQEMVEEADDEWEIDYEDN